MALLSSLATRIVLRLASCTRQVAPITAFAVQMVVYMQQQQHDKDGIETQDELSAFIRSTVTIHSLITDRIDKLQPSQQLTLKVMLMETCVDCMSGCQGLLGLLV